VRQVVCQEEWYKVRRSVFQLQKVWNYWINRKLEMMSDAPTNGLKHVMSNVAYAHSQQFTTDSVFWLVQMTLFVIMLCNNSHFVRPNIILDHPTNDTSITGSCIYDRPRWCARQGVGPAQGSYHGRGQSWTGSLEHASPEPGSTTPDTRVIPPQTYWWREAPVW